MSDFIVTIKKRCLLIVAGFELFLVNIVVYNVVISHSDVNENGYRSPKLKVHLLRFSNYCINGDCGVPNTGKNHDPPIFRIESFLINGWHLGLSVLCSFRVVNFCELVHLSFLKHNKFSYSHELDYGKYD